MARPKALEMGLDVYWITNYLRRLTQLLIKQNSEFLLLKKETMGNL
jgi:hypothetical protein